MHQKRMAPNRCHGKLTPVARHEHSVSIYVDYLLYQSIVYHHQQQQQRQQEQEQWAMLVLTVGALWLFGLSAAELWEITLT